MKIQQALALISEFLAIDPLSKPKNNLQDVERLEKEFNQKLPEELNEYIQYHALQSDFYFDTVGNPMRLYGINNLKKLQEGYNYNPIEQKAIDGWPEHYFMLADEGADPVIIDLNSGKMKIQKLMHGAGSWEYGEIIADNIAQFLLCSSALHHALTGFEEEAIVDDENGFCLAPRASEWYFENIKKWAGDYHEEWCSVFDNY
ncbi:SMI1/KNR4 family protein [Aquimarina algicola]|uniref:SMI1/KNR4 family protein n=1 Tax=Aquimarina algicola TaxID=2589995 RepID=A0A504J7U3_9FLAO|nr:SMI1/KNR4 family protein [Aquimarina algicola]TPN86897.1 SMI1/KNR4 family protein [Aquimarina algicola]